MDTCYLIHDAFFAPVADVLAIFFAPLANVLTVFHERTCGWCIYHARVMFWCVLVLSATFVAGMKLGYRRGHAHGMVDGNWFKPLRVESSYLVKKLLE